MSGKLTDEQIVQAREWHAGHVDKQTIANRLGVSRNTVQRIVDPALGERQLRQKREKYALEREEAARFPRPTDEELRAARRLIPPDHTDLTAIFFGDPKSGRSALDKLRAAGRAI